MGRPTKYDPKYCQDIIEFFDQPYYIYETEERMSASGAIKEIKVKIPNRMPTFDSYGRKIGVLDETLREWAKKYPDFSASYKICKGIQKDFVRLHGMSGGYNGSFTKFVAVNCLDMVDKSEVKTENDHKVDGPSISFALDVKPEDL